MGGLLHLFNLNWGGMARKIPKHNQQVDGLEAPRNNLELPAETSPAYHAIDDSGTNSYPMKEEWSENYQYGNKRSMKKLMKQEISKQPNSRHKAPSLVARLMGIDSFPLDNEPDSVVQKHEKWKIKREESKSASHVQSNSKFYKHSNAHYQCEKESRHTKDSAISKTSRFRSSKHHQEEELQKFKEDFVTWQAENAGDFTLPRHLLAHQKKYKEKKHAGYSKRYKKELRVDEKTKSFMGFDRFAIETSDIKLSEFCAPSRIVILKPGPDGEDPCAASSCISEEGGGLDDFLEEVKTRTKFKLQGVDIRNGCLEPDPKRIAQHIAKQVRESVGRDLEIDMVRSKSHEFGSSKFPKRARNALMEETEFEFASTSGRSSIISGQADGRDGLNQSGSETETGSCSIYEADDDELFSPRNLTRSLSAPIAGCSFPKVLLEEDPHFLSGPQIRTDKFKNFKRGRSNFKDKDSGFRNAYSPSGSCFGRRVEEDCKEPYSIDDIMSGPTVLLNSNDNHENFTEVPPSPVSVHGDRSKVGVPLNPIAHLDLSSGEDDSMPQVFSEITSSLNDLRRQLKELGSEVSPKDNDESDESEEHAKTYTRSPETTLSLSISDYVFEKSKKRCGNVDYKAVVDLTKEALSDILVPEEVKSSWFMKKVCVIYSPPRGGVLLDRVLQAVGKYVWPSGTEQWDELVAEDLGRTRWLRLLDEEFDVMGRDVECLIIQDLIEETTKEIETEL